MLNAGLSVFGTWYAMERKTQNSWLHRAPGPVNWFCLKYLILKTVPPLTANEWSSWWTWMCLVVCFLPILYRAQEMKGSLISPKYFLTGWEVKGDPDTASPMWFIRPHTKKMATDWPCEAVGIAGIYLNHRGTIFQPWPLDSCHLSIPLGHIYSIY